MLVKGFPDNVWPVSHCDNALTICRLTLVYIRYAIWTITVMCTAKYNQQRSVLLRRCICMSKPCQLFQLFQLCTCLSTNRSNYFQRLQQLRYIFIKFAIVHSLQYLNEVEVGYVQAYVSDWRLTCLLLTCLEKSVSGFHGWSFNIGRSNALMPPSIQTHSIQVKSGDFLSHVTLLCAISQFKMELQCWNAKFGSKSTIFFLCELEIRWMTLKNNRIPLLCCFMLRA